MKTDRARDILGDKLFIKIIRISDQEFKEHPECQDEDGGIVKKGDEK